MSAKYRSIILHVGLHKTGSTSIQNNCQFHSHEFLLDHGIFYANFASNGKLRPNHGGPITAALLDDPDKYGKEWRSQLTGDPQREFREYFDEILENPQAEHLLLSGESLSLLEDEDMRLLQSKLLAHTEQLRVLVFLRNPYSFLESIIQQRVRVNWAGDIEPLITVMRLRYERLHNVFGGALEVLNFDECLQHPKGLVGSFFTHCGIPESDLEQLTPVVANTSISLEAFQIMLAINQHCAKEENLQSSRVPRDLRALHALPGNRFHLRDLPDSPHFTQLEEEVLWFEDELGLHFKPREFDTPVEHWPFATLAVLEDCVRNLENPFLREAAARFLQEEAESLPPDQLESATVMKFIGRRILEIDDSDYRHTMRELGPTYFRAGASQVARHSPALALKLLLLARELNPEAEEIEREIDACRARLMDS
jgi:hypothetical protein